MRSARPCRKSSSAKSPSLTSGAERGESPSNFLAFDSAGPAAGKILYSGDGVFRRLAPPIVRSVASAGERTHRIYGYAESCQTLDRARSHSYSDAGNRANPTPWNR